MSQRNLPPSFWRMNHPTQHHSSPTTSTAALALEAPSTSAATSSSFFMPPPPTLGAQTATATPDLYGSDYHQRYPITHQNDPWHYPLSSPVSSSPYHHRHAAHHAAHQAQLGHELGYSSSNRFNAQYSSLLLQPSSGLRSSRLTPVSAACGFDKPPHDMAWLGARYHHDAINFAGHHGIDANYSATAAYGAAMTAAMSGE